MRIRRVALHLFEMSGDYDRGIAKGVIRYAKENGWRLYGKAWTLDHVSDPAKWHGDGIIARMGREHQSELLRAGVPIVDVAAVHYYPGVVAVTNDDFATGRAAGEHLLECGLRNFAFCSMPSETWSDERLAGFRTALGTHGANVKVFEQVWPAWERPTNSRRFLKWLGALPLPLGIMGANDVVGVKVTSACQFLGLEVPRQVAVVGVDNEEVLCELANPQLSSIPCDCVRIGYEAAKTLDLLMRRRRLPARHIRIPPQPLVVRQSSDTYATDDDLVSRALRFIRSHVEQPINVSDVTKAVPLCRRSLEIRFRQVVGHTLHSEIRRTKLEHARHLLISTDLPVAKVALSCGFSNDKHFHSVFREVMKHSPLEYRTNGRGQGTGVRGQGSDTPG